MPDFKPNGFQLIAEFVVPKSQHFDSLWFQKLITLFVVVSLFGEAMTASIKFDGEFGFGTIEIENVCVNGMLSAKLKISETAVSEEFPNFLFCVS